MNLRIKTVRKEKKMKQNQFAELLGITQSGVSWLEQEGNTVSDQIIRSICTQCNINENWLRTGNGQMHIEKETFSLDQFVKDQVASEEELEILKIYFEIEPSVRKSIVDHFKARLTSNTEPIPSSESTLLDSEEEYKKNVLKNVANTDYTALNTTKGKKNA